MALPRAISWDSPQPLSAAAQCLSHASAALLPQGGLGHLKPCLAATPGEHRLCLQFLSGWFMVQCHPPMGRGLLPAGGGQSSEQACWAVVLPKLAGTGLSHPRVTHQNSCYGKRFVDFFLFLFFFFFFLPVLKLPQTSSEDPGISSYRCGIEALVAKYIRHGSWQCCAISINLRKPP